MKKIRNAFFYMTFSIISATYCDTDLIVGTVFDKQAYWPGDTVVVALECIIPEGYHLYGNPLGPGIGKPLELSATDDRGIMWFSAKKTPAKKFQPPLDQWVWAYKGKVYFFIRGKISESAKDTIHSRLKMNGLICANMCLPVTKEIPVVISLMSTKHETSVSFNTNPVLRELHRSSQDIPLNTDTGMKSVSRLESTMLSTGNLEQKKETIQRKAAIPVWDYEPQGKEININILIAIFFAFFAGIILNAMPCVLPVLGIKIISFSEGTAGTKKTAFIKSLFFTAGMLSVFLTLASFAAFANLSWGEQFQKPVILIAIICAIVIFGLGMFDIFMITIPSGISNINSYGHHNFWDDILKGIMTTVLATPCSGPFLGATLAWTLTQKPLIIYTVFIALGLGMASPYILLSVWTGLLKRIPKPGKWTDDLKRIMGFLLLGFALYLTLSLPQNMVVAVLGLCLSLAFGITMYTRYAPYGSSLKKRIVAGIGAIVLVSCGGYASYHLLYDKKTQYSSIPSQNEEALWQEFTADKLQAAHARGQHVLIDFTAAWCMNCQYNKLMVYQSDDVTGLIREKDILALKADLTNSNPAVESLLHHLGSRSIPFLAVFPGDAPYQPVIMRDIVKKGEVVRVLKRLRTR
jgi:thiol:disulfide interchange protein